MKALDQQVAVITGASSGIGRALALELATHGANVCLVGRQLETLEVVAALARGKGSQAYCYRADLSVRGEVDELVARINRELGCVDVLVHCAAVIAQGPVQSTSPEQLDLHYQTNLRAPYVLTQGLLPALKARQGQVLFVNSSAGLGARANVAQYAASKHALKALADSLREEVNPAGVRVLSIFPGRTATAMQAAVHAAEGKPYQPQLLMQPDDVAALAIHALTLPRSIEVTDISMRPMQKS
ncbi:MAG: 3-oxoacyl-(acyl-carrier-protein) reductase [Ramlibacter sp.]|nr:3-oxoacyl-(acyl-carrier-protein) reductase [Ramlibacter sp.]